MDTQQTPTPMPSNKKGLMYGLVAVVVIVVVAAVSMMKKETTEVAESTNPTNTTHQAATKTTPSTTVKTTNVATTTPPKTTTPATTNTNTGGSMMNNTGKTGTVMSAYKNGTYSATGTYRAPSGQESMGVSLTVKNDIVTAVTVTPESTSPISSQYQTNFASNVSAVVVGKKLSDLSLGQVSGSSLTPMGFNNAVEQIKAQAAV